MEFKPDSSATPPSEEDTDLRRGPWTVEEDITLMNYISNHGEGRWNSLARCAGLKRTGKSCRLRWLNYLRPDVRRGNITPEEQLLILELHSRWGNRWSKIAQHLPGRTDNEIKNYWRTRVQKHAKQLQCDVNSKQFKDVMRYLWMPRLLERIRAASGGAGGAAAATTTAAYQHQLHQTLPSLTSADVMKPSPSMAMSSTSDSVGQQVSSSSSLSVATDCFTDCYTLQSGGGDFGWCPEVLPSPTEYANLSYMDLDQPTWGEVPYENLWSTDDIWSLHQQL